MVGDELLRGRSAAVKYRASYFGDDKRHCAIGDDAETEAQGEAGYEAPAIGFHISVKPFVWTPASPDGLPKRGFLGCGLRFTHRARAAGADSRLSIASITAFVEIWFIG